MTVDAGAMCAVVLAAACAQQAGRPPARPAVILGPESRVLMSDFSDVEAIAATPWLVFAATTHGLLIYDRTARRFRAPVTRLDGYPAGRVRRAIAEASGNGVWLDLGAGAGAFRYDVDGRTWTPGAVPPDPGNQTLTVETALSSAPIADALRGAMLTDTRLRTYRFTAAATSPERPEIFFGTNGLGVVRVDKQTGEWEVLTYGLLAPSVGAVVPAPGGIWAASNARPAVGRETARRGLTWVASDLSSTRNTEGGGAALGFSFLSARRLSAAGSDLWLATEQGVLRINASTFETRAWDLPDATSLAVTRRGIWAGTTRGLSLITPDERVQDFGPTDAGDGGAGGLTITSLLASGDTVWVGTSAGLGQVLPGATAVTTPLALADRSSLRVTVRALGRLQDTIVMATERELLWRDPTTRAWTAVPLPLTLGTPTAITPYDGALWIGGTRGLAQAEIASGSMHVYGVPFDMPAAVRDLASDADFLWAATDSGVVRIR